MPLTTFASRYGEALSVAICVKDAQVDPVQRSIWYSLIPEVELTVQLKETRGEPDKQLLDAVRLGVAGDDGGGGGGGALTVMKGPSGQDAPCPEVLLKTTLGRLDD